MKKLIEREKTFNGFIEARREINSSVDGYAFPAVFESYKKKAAEGDVVAQDVLAYYYKEGVRGYLRENYSKYLKWEILSGANGNSFAIEKLQFLFGYAYDYLVGHEDFAYIKYLNDIDEYNYIPVMGQFICAKLVEKMELDEKSLALEREQGDPYRAEVYRDVRKAIDEILDYVVAEMKKTKKK